MTSEQKNLQQILDNFWWDENNIPIELVQSLINFRQRLLSIPNPNFTENDTSVMDNWNEFKYTGLNNIDYISTKFYKEGFGSQSFYQYLCGMDNYDDLLQDFPKEGVLKPSLSFSKKKLVITKKPIEDIEETPKGVITVKTIKKLNRLG